MVMEEIRLNKYLSEMGVCSRREADRLIKGGKVLVDGKPASVGMRIQGCETVVCDGRPVGNPQSGGRPKPVLLAVNKPKGIVCTTTDKDRAPNIVEMVKYPERVYPVGRLDKDSEGLIFLTNQGELVNRIMRGANNHEKEYVVWVNKVVTMQDHSDRKAGVSHCADSGAEPADPKDVRDTGIPCDRAAPHPHYECVSGQLKDGDISEGDGPGIQNAYGDAGGRQMNGHSLGRGDFCGKQRDGNGA